eukprot:jgi/Orpsp1_1/1188108/evm.model.d7180000062480.1
MIMINSVLSIESKKYCGGLFADNIDLVVPFKSALRSILNKVHSWVIKYEMAFSINICCTLIVKPKNLVKSTNYIDPFFFLLVLIKFLKVKITHLCILWMMNSE